MVCWGLNSSLHALATSTLLSHLLSPQDTLFIVLHLVLSEPPTTVYTSMLQSQSFSMTLRNALHSIVLVAVGWRHILHYLQGVLDSSLTVCVCSFDLGPYICLPFSAWCDFSVEVIVHLCCSLKWDVPFACGCFKIFLNFGFQQFSSQGLGSDFLWFRSTDLEFFWLVSFIRYAKFLAIISSNITSGPLNLSTLCSLDAFCVDFYLRPLVLSAIVS